MLDNISSSTTNKSQTNSQSQQELTRKNSTNQITLDFDSILQELKSVGEAHQPDQQTTMIVENITANIKQESQINTNSNNTGKRNEHKKKKKRIIDIGRKEVE